MSRVLQRTFLLLSGVALGLGVAEVVLRARDREVRQDPDGLGRTAGLLPPPYRGSCGSPSAAAGLAGLIRPSAVPDLIYELKPNLDTCYYTARVQTNGDGLRGIQEFERPKPPELFRIALLGDSQTFGQGVELEETFGELIGTRLAARSGRRVEVLNLGVDGYNTVQQAASLRTRGMAYEPDCVAVLFIGDDMDVPSFLLKQLRGARPYGSAVLGLLDGWIATLGGSDSADSFGPVAYSELGRVPEEYRFMVGEAAYQQALADMVALLAPSETPLVQLASYSVRKRPRWRGLVEYEENLGVVVPRFELPWGPDLWLSNANRHLNAAGHLELATRVIAAFESKGVCLPQ